MNLSYIDCRVEICLTVVSHAGTYVRVQLVRAGRVIKVKKTHGQRGTCSPAFNESFTFTVPPGLPDDCRWVVV